MIRATTMLVVVFTTFVFGGSTKTLLDAFNVPCQCKDEDNSEPPAPGSACYPLYSLLVDRRDTYKKMDEEVPVTAPEA